ncbi:ABC transporter ATP-binding protein [Mangrovibacillus cuniculi]|uniref:ABC transporter ATP-binding protein n=1 Tax=Mangrovibacillus cuniculi TaxID=2593652 RepID=A0A7S8C969_9BACI|nr:ABC transporter ATP-binding protein [Mangrovibacillus cuniculi]QPC45721.1 ABC transporter ATP-binding protein [Mangrovibacillus cuniculi]
MAIVNHGRATDRAELTDQWGTIKRLSRYLLHERKKMIGIGLLILGSTIGSVGGPLLIGFAIDDWIVNQQTGTIWPLLVGLVSLFIGQSVTLWIQQFLMIDVAQNAIFRLRTELFHALQQLPIPFYDKRRHGELMSRVTNDVDQISNTLNSAVIQIVSSVLTLGTITALMIWLSPTLTVITLMIIPLMFLSIKWITKRTGPSFKETQKAVGDLNGYIEETVSGQKLVKAFSQEERVLAEFEEKSSRLKKAAYRAQLFSGAIPKVMNLLNNGSFALIAGVGGYLALTGTQVTVGVIVIFVEYARQFTRPLNDLANQFNTLLSAIAGAERVFAIMDEPKEASKDGAKDVDLTRGKVEFKDISFGYEEGERTIKDISFTANPGDTVAFVGPTGAGKTTVTNLLGRFYEPQEGQIFIDDIPLDKMTLHSTRQAMAFVLQDPFLFEGTIRENIRYGRLQASDEEVIEAAKLANAHRFIKKLPRGYDTVLSQDDSGISQGQRQLLSIARAFIAKPTILILDEATSSIDTITEIYIQEALKRLMVGRTSFVIAHRLNTIRQADQIIVLKDGEMIESGTHTELVRRRGFYADLVEKQTAIS